MTHENLIIRLTPRIPKIGLLILAGLMWSAVGIMLFRYAVIWLTQPFSFVHGLFGGLGMAISWAAYHFQFAKLALKNIERILQLKDQACVFGFQAWKGYLIIAVMMTGGILLRGSAIPKPYLAVVYAAIGGALLGASSHYYARFYRLVSASSHSQSHSSPAAFSNDSFPSWMEK